MPTFQGSGINEDQIENFSEYEEILNSLNCCICLDIVKNPVECSKCQSLYCAECWKSMEIAGKDCVLHCKVPIVKANKFVFQILDKLKIRCNNCNQGGISYSKFLIHDNVCLFLSTYGGVVELTKIVDEKNRQIEHLQKKISDIKHNDLTVQSMIQEVKEYSQSELRQKFLTHKLSDKEKMELYQNAIENKVNEFKRLILEKKYPILEEVSAPNFYWTSLHYAMHYGRYDIIQFIMDYYQNNGELNLVMNLESNDGRTPLLSLLKSNVLNNEDKKTIMNKIISKKYKFSLSNEVKKELRNRNIQNFN